MDHARKDPLYLVSQMTALDKRTGARFSLAHLAEPLRAGEVSFDGKTVRRRERSWRWQRLLAEHVINCSRLIVLKGRQIGVTWVCLAVDVAEAILMPGTDSLLFRQRESEAIKNVRRWWILYQSLPPWFKEGIKVLTPDRSEQPGREGVMLQFENLPGKPISSIVPMTSAASSGHGESLRRALLDEGAFIELLDEIMAAVEPAAGEAKIAIVSRANGRSTWDEELEEGYGNEFHRIWKQGSGYKRLFFPYDVHPDRDQHWYETEPQVQSRKRHQRHANFPRSDHEAFALSAKTFFAEEDLNYYRQTVRPPLYRGKFVSAGFGKARLDRSEGPLSVYCEPAGRSYAIGADVATGRGADFSAAYVIDLAEMQLVAEFHARIGADLFAEQLHYLGRWYRTALIAHEVAGGHGEAVTIALRDGTRDRPAYPRIYRHVLSGRPDLPLAKPYGFPTNSKTRPLITNQLEQAVRERTLPFVTDRLLWEMEEFVRFDTGPSPRAQAGSHDDCVIACCIALEMYRLHGSHPDRDERRRRRPRRRNTRYSWAR